MVSSMPLVSVIIPTYNEENWLPDLLECLKKQTFQDFEIVVADNKSTDKTQSIAKSYGARVTDGGLPGRGRNIGAQHAKGEILFFIDADVKLPRDFLENSVKSFKKRKCDVATTFTRAGSNHIFDIFFFSFANLWVFIFQFLSPIAHGFNIIATKKRFFEVKGFDEDFVAGEDFEFVKRASKKHRFRVLYSTYDVASVRRFEKIGRIKMFLHLTMMIFRTMVLRQKLHHKGDYDWTGYGKKIEKGKRITIGGKSSKK
jgi:glycosyltransferase involved in cell wall biosynthesis